MVVQINGEYGNAKELAVMLGLTSRRISQLVQDGVIEKEMRGVFHFPSVIEDYYRWKYSAEEVLDLKKEKALHEEVKREISEIKLAKLRHEMHTASAVKIVMTEMLTNLRTQLLGLPSILAPKLAGRKQEEIQEIISCYIEEKLNELSDYEPTLFAEEENEENS